ncbi:MAG TPA: molybdate ABC transporter permease subunit [Candidatus Avipropionibacterium avicola]|uniref:Molybdenum transport system permease n=1 Tax=Candidatus Avipropionibacterium avicola TaxID=2840701 RepID=A0A9D1GW48_9ACTN|nr:molybdate ABC transporter permease subunit [Candidatus Avipropionibacterium avicola]
MRRFPRWAWVPFALACLFLALPLTGMLTRVDWIGLPGLLTSDRAIDALRLSLLTCTASTLLVLLVGVPTALVLARSTGWWVDAVRTLVTVPMVLPPVVAGLALLVTLGRRGLIGAPLSVLGIQIGFTTLAVVLAQTFVALPYLVVSLDGALRTTGAEYEEAAAHLGAGPGRTFWRVTLPMVAPALASGTALSFARALGEFGASITFAGSLQGVTRALPLEIYLLRETDSDLALALAVVLVGAAIAIVAVSTLMRGRDGRTP